MIFSFGSASTVGLNDVAIGNMSVLSSYVFFAFVAAPLWQCFSVQDAESSEDMGCDHGCMAGMACVHLSGLCMCQNMLVIRNDKLGPSVNDREGGGWWSDPLESESQSQLHSPSYSRSSTTTSVNTATSMMNTPSVSRYIPFSFYNVYYIIRNDAQQELNPMLPFDQMPAFGMGRSILLCFGTSLRASLNLALFYNAYYAVLVQEDAFFMYMSLIALIAAFVDLDIYIVAVFYGTILYPYTLVVWLSFYFPMFDWLLNPKQGSFLFWMLKKYWKTVVSCISVDVRTVAVSEAEDE